MNQAEVLFEKNFTACYLKYSQVITNFLHNLLTNAEAAKDLAQDVFLKIYERKQILDLNCARTKKFLYVIARHKAYDYLKREKTKLEKYHKIQSDKISKNQHFYKDSSKSYLEKEIISTIYETIESFSPEKQNIFLEKNIKEEKLKDVADKSKLSIYKVKQIEKEINRKIKTNISNYL